MRFAGTFVLAVVLAVVSGSQFSYGQDKPAAKAASEFINFPGMPTCVKGAVRTGDPSKGGSVILAKMTSGCVIPWHWHTANEQLMMVSGTAKVEMKDGSPAALHTGSYLSLAAKNAHQFTCAVACTLFAVSDVAFDIHYVDKDGKEISQDEALKSKAKSKAPMKHDMKDMKM